MADILEAKRMLSQKYSQENGFIGVAERKEEERVIIVIYTSAVLSDILRSLIEVGEFEGFLVKSIQTGDISAYIDD